MADSNSVDRNKTLEDLRKYRRLFEAAFDELHAAVIKQLNLPRHYVGPHHDYPLMRVLDSGFPAFSDAGFHKEGSPRDYVGSVRPRGLFSLLIKDQFPDISLPKVAELASFLRSHDVGKRLKLDLFVFDGKTSDAPVERLVEDAVERYLHLYGLGPVLNGDRRDGIIRPILRGTLQRGFELRLVVPIALTQFEVDHFALSETAYIARIPEKLQLGRARLSTLGTGAVDMVVGAATHAFVSNGWSVEADILDDVSQSLRQTSPDVVDAIDTFFGALRIVTGISTGYAQIVWFPKKWALNYFCDLAPVYGTALRQYPSTYDNYGWIHSGETVTTENLKEVRRVYNCLVASDSEAVRLAIRRLNACLTRTESADAILDGTIGLELLLGDDQNQSLSYKLRLRAAALALRRGDPAFPANEIAKKVKELYAARSSIVHGRTKRRSKKASEAPDTIQDQNRQTASDLLRFVLDVLLRYPEYQVPARIDSGLLLQGDEGLSAEET